ncbi:MAG: hypothetical protein B7X54_08095 [Idiomarina sp. 34-48-12]|nr:MAG: hypothetical protein B7X54_08095 [Idiomarina sp. 34-48-12]
MSESNKQKPATDEQAKAPAPKQPATEAKAPTVKTTPKATADAAKKGSDNTTGGAPSTSSKPKSTEVGKSAKRNSALIGWVIVVLLAAVIIIAMWFGYTRVWPMHQQQITSMAQQQETSAATIEQLQGRLDNLEQSVSAAVRSSVENLEQRVDSQLGRQQQVIDDYQLAVQSVQAELANLDISQESNWRIYEARNLAERAATKLWIENDANAALAFLRLAESHIIALDNPAHMQARQALANDIAQLEQLPENRIETVSLKLGTLRDQVAQSQWYQQLAMSSDEASTAADDSWLSNLKRSLNTLMQQFVRVQRRDTPVEPMIADAYFDVLQQRLLLQLQIGQQAAMNGSQAVYEANINEAITLLTRLQGQVNDADVSRFIDELQALKGVQLQPDYPAALNSTTQLERLANQIAQTNQGD